MTISDSLSYAVRLLSSEKKFSHQTASFEATQLLQYLLKLSRFELLMNQSDNITDTKFQEFQNMLQKRCEDYPLQYLIGEWDFFGLTFKVGEGVLIPRSDTEILVELALESIVDINSPVVADLCSGSGCIAVSISKNRPDAKVYAVELSNSALPYLLENVKINNCDISVIHDDVFSWKPPFLLDAIISNPPYLTDNDIANLQPELEFEPQMALHADHDGMIFFEKLPQLFWSFIKPGGFLAFEIGAAQALEVKKILFDLGYCDLNITKDLSGLDRIVSARKPVHPL